MSSHSEGEIADIAINQLRARVAELETALGEAERALELSHKCHENLYVSLWGHLGLKPEDDISYREVAEALAAIRKVKGV